MPWPGWADVRVPVVSWPTDQQEAISLQLELRAGVELGSDLPAAPRTVCGLDVSYDTDSARVVAAAVVLDARTLAVVQEATAVGEALFPYVPGLLAFRELPTLLLALRQLTVLPDVLVCDGYGVAHPRRFGLACHLGVLTGLPSFGVAKTPFTTRFESPGRHRGDWSDLVAEDTPSDDDGEGGEPEVLGRVLRTQQDVKPVFVSVGHRIGLGTAAALTLALCRDFRLPETTRHADRLSRRLLRAGPVAAG